MKVSRRGAGCDVEEQRGEPVGERLRRGSAGLRLGDESLNAGERGVIADRFDSNADRGIGGNGPRDDAVVLHPSSPDGTPR